MPKEKTILMDENVISYYNDGTIVFDVDEPTDHYDEIAAKMADIIRETMNVKKMQPFEKANAIVKTVKAFEGVLNQ